MGADATWSVPDDRVRGRLAALADQIEAAFGDLVEVRRGERLPEVSIEPTREGACWVSWIELRDEVVLQVSDGGRWELERTMEDVELLERIVESVAAGRAVEVFGPARSSVTVTLHDGSTETSGVRQGLKGCLPAPGWPRWGRKVQYLPYAGQ